MVKDFGCGRVYRELCFLPPLDFLYCLFFVSSPVFVNVYGECMKNVGNPVWTLASFSSSALFLIVFCIHRERGRDKKASAPLIARHEQKKEKNAKAFFRQKTTPLQVVFSYQELGLYHHDAFAVCVLPLENCHIFGCDG